MRYTIFVWRERPLLNLIRFLFVGNCLRVSHSNFTWASGRVHCYMETFFTSEKKKKKRHQQKKSFIFKLWKTSFIFKRNNWHHVVTAFRLDEVALISKAVNARERPPGMGCCFRHLNVSTRKMPTCTLGSRAPVITIVT